MNTIHADPFGALACAGGTGRARGHEEHAARRPFDARQGEDTDFGGEADLSKVSRTIRVEMADTMRFAPASLTVRKGQTVKLVVHNGGHVLHEMVLGTAAVLDTRGALMKRFLDMAHADPNMTRGKAGQAGEVVWQFTNPGEFRFACLQPGHCEAGMVGKVVVK